MLLVYSVVYPLFLVYSVAQYFSSYISNLFPILLIIFEIFLHLGEFGLLGECCFLGCGKC